MSQEILLSGLIGAVASALIYVVFYHYTEYQKFRINLLEEFTRYYDNVFMDISFMQVYQRRQSQDLPLLERHADLYSTYNNQLRELQLSSNIDVKIRAFYSDRKLITLHQTLAEETNNLIRSIRRARSNQQGGVDASITATGDTLTPIRMEIENIMIYKIKNGGFCEICLPTFYSWCQKLTSGGTGGWQG